MVNTSLGFEVSSSPRGRSRENTTGGKPTGEITTREFTTGELATGKSLRGGKPPIHGQAPRGGKVKNLGFRTLFH